MVFVYGCVALLALDGAFTVDVCSSCSGVAGSVCWSEVVEVVGSACVVGDDVVCGVCSGFATEGALRVVL
jgi:hypothetical protein